MLYFFPGSSKKQQFFPPIHAHFNYQYVEALSNSFGHFKFPWKMIVEEEGRFMEGFAYSVGQAYETTNGGSPHGGATWSNRKAIVLKHSDNCWQTLCCVCSLWNPFWNCGTVRVVVKV